MTRTTEFLADNVTDQIREIVVRFGDLAVDIADIDNAADLFRAGMGSLCNVNVMLALEGTFGIEFPESMLSRATFRSVEAIRRAVLQLIDQRCEP